MSLIGDLGVDLETATLQLEEWVSQAKQAQARFGRGLARELTQQLLLTIEDYR